MLYFDKLPIELRREILSYILTMYCDFNLFEWESENYFKLTAFSFLRDDNALWQFVYARFFGLINFRQICCDKSRLDDRDNDSDYSSD